MIFISTNIIIIVIFLSSLLFPLLLLLLSLLLKYHCYYYCRHSLDAINSITITTAITIVVNSPIIDIMFIIVIMTEILPWLLLLLLLTPTTITTIIVAIATITITIANIMFTLRITCISNIYKNDYYS